MIEMGKKYRYAEGGPAYAYICGKGKWTSNGLSHAWKFFRRPTTEELKE